MGIIDVLILNNKLYGPLWVKKYTAYYFTWKIELFEPGELNHVRTLTVSGVIVDALRDAGIKAEALPLSSLGCQGEEHVRDGCSMREQAIHFQREERTFLQKDG